MPLSCKVCQYSVKSIPEFVRLAKEHRNLANYRFSCGFFQCPCNFKTAVGLRTHMYRNHAVITPSADKSHSGVNMTCQVMECSFTSTSGDAW